MRDVLWSIVRSVGLVIRTRPAGVAELTYLLGFVARSRYQDSYLSLPTYALDPP